MAATKDNLIQEYRNWVRFFILTDYDGGSLCLHVFFKRKICQVMECSCIKEQNLNTQEYGFEDQRQVLCPSSEIANYNFFYLIFFTRIIEVIFRSKYESLVKDMRNLRNEECHRSNKEVPNTDFVNLWKCTADMLEKCSLDFSLVDDLKDCDPRIMSSAFEVDGFLLFRII